MKLVRSFTDHRGLRLLLLLGAAISIGTGIPAIFAVGILKTSLGLVASGPGFVALSRLYGEACIAMGLVYVVAAIDPLRYRGLMPVLLLVPLMDLVGNIAGMTLHEIAVGRGIVFSIVDLSYSLLFVRLYPKGAPVK